MKTVAFYFALVILFITGCSKDDESTSSEYQEFSPPAWVIGKWEYDPTLGVYFGHFEVTENNLIQVHVDGSSFSWRDVALEHKGWYQMVDEIKSDDEYLLRIDAYSNSIKGNSNYYHFKRTGNKDVVLFNLNNSQTFANTLHRMK